MKTTEEKVNELLKKDHLTQYPKDRYERDKLLYHGYIKIVVNPEWNSMQLLIAVAGQTLNKFSYVSQDKINEYRQIIKQAIELDEQLLKLKHMFENTMGDK